jgi:hypothetical protein
MRIIDKALGIHVYTNAPGARVAIGNYVQLFKSSRQQKRLKATPIRPVNRMSN